MPRGRSSSSTRPSPRQPSSDRSNTAPMSWSIPSPNISTAMAICSAASWSATPPRCTPCETVACAILPARRSLRWPASSSCAASKPCICGCASMARTRWRWPRCWPPIRRCASFATRSSRPIRAHAIARRQMSGGSGMMSFELRSGYDGAVRLMNRLQLIARAVSLGDVESPSCIPAGSPRRGKRARLAEAATGVTMD